jgi:hypothetical protein
LSNYPLISTVGVEYEVENIHQQEIGRRLDGNFRQTHDASIETDVISRGNGIFIKSANNLLQSRRGNQTLGTEIITVPFDTESKSILDSLKFLTQLLMEMGEPEKSLRAGIHVHINMSYNLKILKSILRLGRFLEDTFFLIGTQGYVFRGMKVNESAYCRPITKWGPQCVRTHSGSNQVFNIKDLLKSETVEGFWWRYGSLIVNEGSQFQRYVPQRYTWLNLYSLLQHGTLEFRLFNKTLSPYRIAAEISFCQKFCEYAITSGFATLKQDDMLEEHSVYDERPKEEIIDTFLHFAEKVHLEENYTSILLDIITTAPLVKLPQSFIWTHLEPARDWWGRGYQEYVPPNIPISEIHSVDIQDIHTLRGERRPN